MESKHRWPLVLAAITAVGFAQACNEDDKFTAAPPIPEDLGTVCAYNADCDAYCLLGLRGMAPYCTRNCSAEEVCPAGFVCVGQGQMGQVCTMGECTGDADCPETYGCNTDRSLCWHDDIECGSDADCPAETACNQAVCATVCQSDDDCKQGYLCDYDTRCVECVQPLHCDNGFACAEGHCNAACVQDQDCRQGFVCTSAACTQILGGGPGEVGSGCDNNDHSQCAGFCQNNMCNQICDPADAGSCPPEWVCSENHGYCQQSSG